MNIEWNWPGGGIIYEWGEQSIPREGEDVEFDGSDPHGPPQGGYRVRKVVWFVGLRGVQHARIVLR